MLPFFSIIIPTYNRPQQLATCLQALAQLDYPRERFEVIVVDDGSPQSLDAIVASFKGRLDIILLHQKNAGPAAARNNGAAHAKGDHLAFVDDDCEPASDWLTALATQLDKTPDCMLGARLINKPAHNPFSSTSQLILDIVYRHYNADPRITPSRRNLYDAKNFAGRGADQSRTAKQALSRQSRSQTRLGLRKRG